MQNSQRKAIIVHPLFRNCLPKAVKQGEPARWSHLPLDLMHRIAGSLDTAKDLCNFERVSRACWVVASDEQLWRRLCWRDFSVPRSIPCHSWRDLYRFNHSVLYDLLMCRKPGKVPNLTPGGFIGIPVLA
eukprot:jgi/Astpho2/2095/Aster-x1037